VSGLIFWLGRRRGRATFCFISNAAFMKLKDGGWLTFLWLGVNGFWTLLFYFLFIKSPKIRKMMMQMMQHGVACFDIYLIYLLGFQRGRDLKSTPRHLRIHPE